MSSRRKGFFYRFRLPLKILGVSILVALGLGAFYALSLVGPRPVDTSRSVPQVDRAEALELLAESQRMEERFQRLAELRRPQDQDLDLLRQAIDKQQQFLAATGGVSREGNERLQSLRRQYQNHVTVPLREESVEAELRGNNHELQDRRSEALADYRRAMELQRTINERYPLSEHRDVGRLTQLERRFRVLEGRPLYDRSLEAENAARRAIEEGDYAQALEHLREAINTQREMNNRYRDLMYADMRRLSALEREMTSLQTSDAHHEIEALVVSGREAADRESYREAADYFQQAARRQRRLIQEFPQSRFATSERLNELEVKVENALSRELGERILVEFKLLQGHLRARSIWQATEILQTLEPQARRFRESFPRSDLVDEQVLLQLQFLGLIQDDLGHLQERIYGQILPIPGDEGWHMAKTEVSQAMYASIMNSNPSRNRDDRLPVDSVNWHEAVEFCQKVSWILSREVRLPSVDEFRAALGSLRFVDLNTVSWNANNSNMRTHPVATKEANQNGFHDLLGNVAEWLSPDALPPGEAFRAGGDAEDSTDLLADVPIDVSNKRTRNRMTGFRYVVNMTD